MQYFLRIPADNNDFRKRGTNWKMLFYFKSFKYLASPHLWHFRSEALMFTIREILTTEWRQAARDDPGPDVKPHIRPQQSQKIYQLRSNKIYKLSSGFQDLTGTLKQQLFAFCSGEINSPLIEWYLGSHHSAVLIVT